MFIGKNSRLYHLLSPTRNGKDGANEADIVAYLQDKNIPADEITLNQIAEQIIQTPPEQGYLTISNALQWRLQYQRVVNLTESISGIEKIVSYNKPQ